MQALTQLTGQCAEVNYQEPRGAVTVLHCEPTPGLHLKVVLGAAGLVIRRGEIAVAIPLPEILAAVAAQYPEMIKLTTEAATQNKTPLQMEIARLMQAKSGIGKSLKN